MDIWKTVHVEREALVDDLRDLTNEQWQSPSLCEGWSVHDVVAHLTDDAKATKPAFILSLLAARFDFHRLNQRGVDRERQATGAKTLAAFDAVKQRTTSAPAPLASRLVEVIVHGEDIRRPLDIEHTYPVEAIAEALRYQVTTSESTGGAKQKVRGRKLVATDTDGSHGDGPEISAPILELLMCACGRPTEVKL